MKPRKQLESYPQSNLSNQILKHHQQMLQFLFYTHYDITYETFDLQHASYLQRKRGQFKEKFKSQQIAKYYSSMSEKLHLRILRDDIQLDKRLSKLQILWHNRNLPYFHRYYFEKYLLFTTFKNLEETIRGEERLVQSEEHPYYAIFKAINARESCVRQLKKMLADLHENDVYQYLHIGKERLFNEQRKNEREKYRNQGYKLTMSEPPQEGKLAKTKLEFFSDSFNHLSKLTIYTLELISKWKEYVTSFTSDSRKKRERIMYYFHDDNYLLKILNDNGFVKTSFLSQFYEFAPRNDPFLLHTILSFEKKEEKTVDHELLKHIFMPEKEHLSEIMAKLDYLSQEYRSNIRNKVGVDKNVLKKQFRLSEEKSVNNLNNDHKERVANLVLKKIESPLAPKKSKSTTAFRIKDASKQKSKERIVIDSKRRIVIDFQKKATRKQLNSMPGVVQKLSLQPKHNSPLKNSVLISKNEDTRLDSIADDKMVDLLKKEVVKQIKEDFNMQLDPKLTQNESLEIYINSKLNEAMKSIFPYMPQKEIKPQIELTAEHFHETQVQEELNSMFKKEIIKFHDMQYGEIELLKKVENAGYCYFIRMDQGQEHLGRAIFTLDQEITEYKVLKLLYLNFVEALHVEQLILKLTDFLWDYENAFEVHFPFFEPASNSIIKQLIELLEKPLQKHCLIARKQVYSSVAEVRFIFKRGGKNVNFIPNPYPFSLSVEAYVMMASHKVMLENKNSVKDLQLFNLDYLLMQLIRKCVDSAELLILKEKVAWQSRLKIMLEMAKQEEEQGINHSSQTRQYEAQNITDINNELTKDNHKLLQVSDLTKSNTIKLLTFSIQLSMPFRTKSVYGLNHIQFYRYQIQSKRKVITNEALTQFYRFPSAENPRYQIMFFSARQYLKDKSNNHSTVLNCYIHDHAFMRKEGVRQFDKYIDHLWAPMARFPHQFREREEVYLPTFRSSDLHPIKKEVIFGAKMEWFCSMEMDNAIKYKAKEADIYLQHPLGLAILEVQKESVIFGKIFT